MNQHQAWTEAPAGNVVDQQQHPPQAHQPQVVGDSHEQQQQQQQSSQQQHYPPQQYAPVATTEPSVQHAAAAIDYATLYGTAAANNSFGASEGASISTSHSEPQQQQRHHQQTSEVAQQQYSPDSGAYAADDLGPPIGLPHENRKRQICKFPGCTRVVKSGGHCQAHGAKSKRCSVEGCDKQAQTTHEGMCKRHWKLKNFPSDQPPSPSSEPHLKSVYETVLPQSIAFRPMAAAKAQESSPNNSKQRQQSMQAAGMNHDPLDPPPAPEGATVMPLVAFLQEGASKPFGWHRNEERLARGLKPISNLSSQLEEWERQLAVVETLLLGGGTPYANFQNLAHGWGRKKGFHSALITTVCERRGDMIRKRRIEFGANQRAENGSAKKAARES